MRVIFDEGRKMEDPGVLYNDPQRLQIFTMASLLYNMSLCIKFSVSIVLYFKTIDNLGTAVHN